MYGRCVAVRRSVLPATRPIRGAAGICLAGAYRWADAARGAAPAKLLARKLFPRWRWVGSGRMIGPCRRV